jgi:hypothetical protein
MGLASDAAPLGVAALAGLAPDRGMAYPIEITGLSVAFRPLALDTGSVASAPRS